MILPRRVARHADDKAPSHRLATPVPRVLIADDVPQNREVLARWLARQHYQVDSAADGQQALELAAARRYDLVLLDVEMPRLDGFEALRHLKESEATREIPVIMISGLNELPAIARCIKAGAEDYLSKPFEPVLLAARIDASLERKRLRDAEVDHLRQVSRLVEAARALETGKYETGALGDVAVRPDELGLLARNFDRMAREIHAREQRLHARIEALRSEIGEQVELLSGEDVASAVTHRISQISPLPVPVVLEPGLAPGTVFGQRFEILSPLGSGGMGIVYRARDRELDQDVAIKLLHSNVEWDTATAIERFKTEIKLARRISSPHVVRTHDLGVSDGILYLTMEYVPGTTLRALLDRRAWLAPDAALEIAGQLAQALEVAHRVGVIHRDIKPENLLLDRDGVLKVMDFGVALMMERANWASKAGGVMGTPAYMSPEQLLGDALDVRADLYATGVVLYECLTGRRPFDADNVFQLVAKVLETEAVPVDRVVSGVSRALSALVMRLMAKHREERPSGARELADLLAAVS